MRYYIYILLLSVLLIGCSHKESPNQLNRVGLLIEGSIDDQGWNNKGYQGLLKIQSQMNVEVFYKETINSLEKTLVAVEEFSNKDVNLIFGHGRIYAEYFQELKDEFPHLHFVSFNGEVSGNKITSLHFDSHAMGFFGGMVAAKMSETKKIGVIAAYNWQPEIHGFIEGAKYQDNNVEVLIDYVGDWNNVEDALLSFEKMNDLNADVYYPAGDGFHVPVVEAIKNNGLFAIGYVSDQIDLGESTVLTSTVQHVDQLYYVVAENFNRGDLKAGNHYFDFKEGVISMGAYSPVVSEQFQEEVNASIDEYIQSGKLPNEL